MIASVGEPAAEVIDGEMAKLGGEVTHRPVAEVLDQLEAAEEAADAAAREARRALREKRKPRSKPTSTNAWEAEGETPRRLISTHRVALGECRRLGASSCRNPATAGSARFDLRALVVTRVGQRERGAGPAG